MTVRKNRVEKLEEAAFGQLAPRDRVFWALKYAGAGEEDQARRIAEAAPQVTYRSADLAFTKRLDDLLCLAKAGAGLIDRCSYAVLTVQAQGEGLMPHVAKIIGGRASDCLSAWEGLDESDLDRLDKHHEEVSQAAVKVLDLALDVWRKVLLSRFRAEWAGFDAFCREETGLDARTLLEAAGTVFGSPPDLLRHLSWLDGALSEELPEDGLGKMMRERQEEAFDSWREAWSWSRDGEKQNAIGW